MILTNPTLKTISELASEKLFFDQGMMDALHSYWRYGLNPGSFGVACLLGDYTEAYSRSHFALRIREQQDTIVLNMVSYASYLPAYCRGNLENIARWTHLGGATHAPKDVLMLCKLEWPDELFGSFSIARKPI